MSEPEVQPVVDLVPYQQEAQQLQPTDEQSAAGAMLFIAKCKESEKSLDTERKGKTDKLREDIENITKPYRLAIDAFVALRTEVQARLTAYDQKVEAKRLEDQRLANLEAERVRIQEQQKTEKARADAEAARESGDLLGALKFDAKADKAELKAMTATPVVIAAAPKTVTFDDGTSVTNRKGKDWVYENGAAKGEKRHRDDPRFRDVIPDEYWLLDESKIGAIVRSGGKVPGVRVFETRGIVARKS